MLKTFLFLHHLNESSLSTFQFVGLFQIIFHFLPSEISIVIYHYFDFNYFSYKF